MKRIIKFVFFLTIIVFAFKAEAVEKKPIENKDVKLLGEPKIITDLPEKMKVMLKCEKRKIPKKIMFCYGQKAPKLMSKAFGHSKKYNEKNGDVMIRGMAWYDLFYSTLLWKNKKYLKRYRDNDYGKGIKLFNKTFIHKKSYDEKIIRTLISSNNGRKSMREALGMSLDLDPETAIKRFWALGELLGLGEAKKNIVDPEMIKRRDIIVKYTDILGKMKKNLEDSNK